jgi:dTDP-4-dehydrorhamnose reductase
MYAITKREGELAAAEWEKHWIVRTCGLYARPSHTEARNFVKTILRVGRTRGQVRVVDDQFCTPSYVPHVARALLEVVGATSGRPASWGTYHVVNSGSTTWHAMAVEIFRQAGLSAKVDPISTAEYAFPTPRPAYSVLDTTRYHALGYAPMPDWQAALAEYFAEWRQLPEEQR